MSLIYLFIKIFPIFGLSISIAAFDLARNFRRKGNKAWIGMIAFSGVFVLLTLAWIWFAGYKNADAWFRVTTSWLHGK
jgi:putative effector of murein hydrolase